MNSLPRAVRRILRSGIVPAFVGLWYAVWSTGVVLTVASAVESRDGSVSREVAGAENSQGHAGTCDSTSTCCCGAKAHADGKCCCGSHHDEGVPVPGVLSWETAPCSDGHDDASIPETARIPPHVLELDSPVDLSDPGAFVEFSSLAPLDPPTRGIEKVPLQAVG